MDIMKEIQNFINKLNEKGIPLPMVRDPATGKSSVSLTLLVISSIHLQMAMINKFAKLFQGMDTENSIEFFLICAGLYFGRSLSKKVASTKGSDDEKS